MKYILFIICFCLSTANANTLCEIRDKTTNALITTEEAVDCAKRASEVGGKLDLNHTNWVTNDAAYAQLQADKLAAEQSLTQAQIDKDTKKAAVAEMCSKTLSDDIKKLCDYILGTK